MHGKGHLASPDGGRYDGDWVLGLRSGKGLYIIDGAESYSGEWEKNLRHGKGNLIFISKNCPVEYNYLGEFQGGKKHGTGTFHWKLVKTPGSRKNSTSSVPSSPPSVNTNATVTTPSSSGPLLLENSTNPRKSSFSGEELPLTTDDSYMKYDGEWSLDKVTTFYEL
jgi:hypothetical protein